MGHLYHQIMMGLGKSNFKLIIIIIIIIIIINFLNDNNSVSNEAFLSYANNHHSNVDIKSGFTYGSQFNGKIL